jgi:hypothetical protein
MPSPQSGDVPGPFHPLVEQWKRLSSPVNWSLPDASDGQIGFLASLDIEGVTVVDFALRGTAYEHRVDAAVTLQLEIGAPGIRTRTPLMRVDWRPISLQHRNPDRSILVGDHVHPFDLNWLEVEQRMRRHNLPYAASMPHPTESYLGLLDAAKAVFRISNIDIVPPPEWSPKLI